METVVNNLIELITNLATTFGPFLIVFIIVIESMIPIIPLAIFIALNIIIYGMFWGYIISWIATILGCMISFAIFRHYFSEKIYKRMKDKKRLNKLMDWISDVKFTHLVILVAIPFTPAFAVNIAAGLSKISKKKYFLAISIGKIFMVYFWGYIGYNILEMFSRPQALLEVIVMLTIAYLVSMALGKKLNIE